MTENNQSQFNFPRLIRYNNGAARGSPKRQQMGSADNKQNQKTEDGFHITDLKQYERMQRQDILDRSFSPRLTKIKQQDKSPELEIQAKMNSRKANKFSMYDLMPIHIKEFFQGRIEIVQILDDYGIINEQLTHLIQTVKCYRFELGSSLERISSIFFKILERLLEQNIKIYDEKKIIWEKQIDESMKTIQNLEIEMKQMDGKQRNIKNLLGYHESEYKICKLTCDSLQNEVIMLHDLIKTDLQKMIMRIGQLEDSRKAPDLKSQGPASEDPSDKLVYNLHNLTKLITNLESEHQEGTGVIDSMNLMLKAMLKGAKQDQSTQVDEGELSANTKILLHNRKDKDELQEIFSNDTEVMKVLANNWTLSKNLMFFLKNAIKNNDIGRVIPWNAFKDMIYNIYIDRIQDNSAIEQINGNNAIPFDEYLVLYILKLHKNRRVSEEKLMEFLISLKYHMKGQVRAIMFAKFCGIIPLSGQINENIEVQLTYKLDQYFLSYFLFCFQTINQIPRTGNFVESGEGILVQENKQIQKNQDLTITIVKAIELVNTLLPFALEPQKLKLRKKLDSLNVTENTEKGVNVDVFYGYLLQEYLESKRITVRTMVKQFTRRVHGDYSGISDFNDFKYVMDQDRGQGYPIISEIVKLRTFYLALISAQNAFDINSVQMLQACSQNGIDAPFYQIKIKQSTSSDQAMIPNDPTIISQLEQDYLQQTNESVNAVQIKPDSRQGQVRDSSISIKNSRGSVSSNRNNNRKQSIARTGRNSILGGDFMQPKKDKDIIEGPVKQERQAIFQAYKIYFYFPIISDINKLNISQITLLTQHYAILKELRNHCNRFVDVVDQENNPKKLWQRFQEISNVLEAACNFLNFPLFQK